MILGTQDDALKAPGAVPARCSIDALYVHVPFCFHKCHYCDFYSIVDDGDDPRHQRFTDALIRELDWWAAESARLGWGPLRPRTIFVGGGTPTILSCESWQRLLDALRRHAAIERVEEFTVEANPETVTLPLMELLARGGVNRVSLGAQSFQPQLLEALQRKHDPANVAGAAAICREAGLRRLNLDLIYAIPGQTLSQLDADLEAVLQLDVEHLSCYGLTYEPGTALTRRRRQGLVTPLDEQTERVMFARVMERLADAGYRHYEISNWARQRSASSGSGSRCAHNLVYWNNGNWLGIGPSAASHIDGLRWKNQPNLDRYLSAAGRPPCVDGERLPPDRRVGEALMLGLRLRDGVAWAWLTSRLRADDARRSEIDELCALGLLEHEGENLRLTREGIFVADAIFEKLL